MKLHGATSEPLNDAQVAAEVRAAADVFAALFEKEWHSMAGEVTATAQRFEPLFDAFWRNRVRALAPYLEIGAPTSIMRLVGLSGLEKPFNRILKWCADERGEHGFGREFLKALCAHPNVRFQQMFQCLDAGDEIELWGEEKVDDSENMPDLVVRTKNRTGAAMMFENKVNSGASGDQYECYPKWFAQFADGRMSLSILSARYTLKEPPIGWDRFISHPELAQVFHNVAGNREVPVWGRITALQCAAAFENAERNSIAELVRAVKHNDRVGIADLKALLDFRAPRELIEPWKTL